MLNKLAAFMLFGLSVVAIAHASDVEQITDDNVPFIYESRAELQASKDMLAEFLSVDYRRARDEFTKHELMQKILPVLEKRLADARSNDNYVLRINSRLGQYDFKNQKFPTGFSASTYIPYDNGYALTFENATDIEFLPLELEKAKELSKQLQTDRRITAIVYITVEGTEEKKLSYRHNKALKATITDVEYEFNGGNKIASFTLQR